MYNKNVALTLALTLMLMTQFAYAQVQVEVSPFLKSQAPKISEHLLGVNTLVQQDTDTITSNYPKIIDRLKDLKPTLMRWPGGNELDTFHWEQNGIRAYRDAWQFDEVDPPGMTVVRADLDAIRASQGFFAYIEALETYLDTISTDLENPQRIAHFNAINYYPRTSETNNTEYMDLEEYLAYCDLVGTQPIVGINMESGRRYNRFHPNDSGTNNGALDDSISEAVRLMRRVEELGYNVTYWYLDNEAYDASAADFAADINLMVPVLRAENPNAKFIVNPASTIQDGTFGWEKYKEFLLLAGLSVDIIDVHLYWSFTNLDDDFDGDEITPDENETEGSFTKLTQQEPLLYTFKSQAPGKTYTEEIQSAYGWLEQNGLSHLEIAALEWNVGKSESSDWSANKIALGQAEMMMQFMNSPLKYANLWPKFNSAQTPVERGLFNPDNDYSTQPGFSVLYLLSKAMGEHLGEGVYASEEIPSLATIMSEAANGNKELRTFLLNKTGSSKTINIGALGEILDSPEGVLHSPNGINSGLYSRGAMAIQTTNRRATFTLPPHSFATARLKVKPDILLAGWDTFNATSLSPPQIIESALNLSATLNITGALHFKQMSSNDGSYGIFGGNASEAVATSESAIRWDTGGAAKNVQIALSNNGLSDISIGAIHLDAFREWNGSIGSEFRFIVNGDVSSYTSNWYEVPTRSITLNDGETVDFTDYSVSIDHLTDVVLNPGESATITIEFGGATNFAGTIYDNIAISGRAN